MHSHIRDTRASIKSTRHIYPALRKNIIGPNWQSLDFVILNAVFVVVSVWFVPSQDRSDLVFNAMTWCEVDVSHRETNKKEKKWYLFHNNNFFPTRDTPQGHFRLLTSQSTISDLEELGRTPLVYISISSQFVLSPTALVFISMTP